MLTALLPAACGGDEITEVVTVGPEPGTGAAGESCSTPTDCADDLLCLRGVCVTSEADLGLGAKGDSCAANNDCSASLSCIANVCVDPAEIVEGGSQVGPGKRGESCQTRSDCETGLTCISGQCTIEEFGLEPTGKVCVSSACGAVEDCIQNVNCDTYQAQCELSPGSFYCDYYDVYCVEANWACTGGACLYTASCATDVNCPSNLVCDPDSMECVQCHSTDTLNCFGNEECVDNTCQASCLDNADCPLFSECNTEDNTCVEVGCQTDRECVAYTSNALAVCEDGECSVPCQSDGECGDYFPYNFKACVEGTCISVGCETDEECRIYNGSFGNWACVPP
jgi:hypothetical protein